MTQGFRAIEIPIVWNNKCAGSKDVTTPREAGGLSLVAGGA